MNIAATSAAITNGLGSPFLTGCKKRLVKILKKFDKRTGALLCLPFIEKVLQQPFFAIDLLYNLVKECETMLDHLFLLKEAPSAITAERNESTVRGQKEVAQIEDKESLYMKSSLSALRALKEIRSGSSTVSVFSLPPLQVGVGLDEPWNKVSER